MPHPVVRPDLATSPVCYVTPCHGGDLERFELLRHSLNRFSSGIPHYVLLDSEDLALFQDRFAGEDGLYFVTSRELLPTTLESRRRASKSWRGQMKKRIAWRLGLLPDPLNGWRLQQLLKIHFLSQCPHHAAVFMDSDIVLCGHMSSQSYFSGNNLVLLESPASTTEDFAFDVCTHLMLRQSLRQKRPLFNYIHQAPRFQRSTAQALIRQLAERNPQGWENRFIDLSFPSEYCLLGYAARELEHYQGYAKLVEPPESWIYQLHEANSDALAELLRECTREGGRRKFLLIQSNMKWPASAYSQQVRALLDQMPSG